MTTVQQAVDATFRRLGQRSMLNRLSASIDADDTTVTLDFSSLPAPGTRVAVGLEDMHVWDASGQTLTVQRGVNGTTGASASSGALVYVEPEYSPFDVLQAINDTLAVLPGQGLFKFLTVDLTFESGTTGYDLTSVGDLLRVHRVSWQSQASDDDWPVIPRKHWTVQQKSSTSEFASAEALFLYEQPHPSATVRVLYEAPFTALSTLAQDLETDAGLPAYAHALIPVGAAYRLLLGRAPARAAMDGQGDTRRPEEVSATDARTTLAALYQEWLTLLAGAKRDQLRKYGTGA